MSAFDPSRWERSCPSCRLYGDPRTVDRVDRQWTRANRKSTTIATRRRRRVKDISSTPHRHRFGAALHHRLGGRDPTRSSSRSNSTRVPWYTPKTPDLQGVGGMCEEFK